MKNSIEILKNKMIRYHLILLCGNKKIFLTLEKLYDKIYRELINMIDRKEMFLWKEKYYLMILKKIKK